MPDNQTIGQDTFMKRNAGNTFAETSKVGKRGAIVVPARLRRKLGIEEGSLVIAEAREDGILIRSAVAYPVEIYTAGTKGRIHPVKRHRRRGLRSGLRNCPANGS
jgi:AbrB family looped-hinge helix DNA binding protein